MKRVIISSFLSFLFPFLLFLFILNSDFNEVVFYLPLAHSLLIFIVFAVALCTSYVAYNSYIKFKEQIFFILSLAFFTLGFVFFLHMAAIFIGDRFFKGEFLDITEHYGLFLGAIFFLGIFLPKKYNEKIWQQKSKIFNIVLIILCLFFISGAIFPVLADILEEIENIVIVLTGIIFLVSTCCVLKKFFEKKNSLLSYTASSLAVFVNTGIIPLFYVEQGILWWYFHFVIVFGFLITLIGLLRSITQDQEAEFEMNK